ncbi:MAG: hypothetical protein HY766_16925 [candidate division NC10 bacterium]|nr:hypothetical protein [candidate division NC10 bacterium]
MIAETHLRPARISLVAFLLAFGLLVGAVIPLHRQALARAGQSLEERIWLLPPPTALRVASLGFQSLRWTRTSSRSIPWAPCS